VSQLLPCLEENQQPRCQDKSSLAGGLADSRSMIYKEHEIMPAFSCLFSSHLFLFGIHSRSLDQFTLFDFNFLVALTTSPPILHHPCHPPFLRRPSWGGLVFYFYKQCFPFLCIYIFFSLGFAFRALLTLSQYFMTTTSFF
jgi:hypothetical protein